MAKKPHRPTKSTKRTEALGTRTIIQMNKGLRLLGRKLDRLAKNDESLDKVKLGELMSVVESLGEQYAILCTEHCAQDQRMEVVVTNAD